LGELHIKELLFEMCDTRILGGGKKFICSRTFLGATDFMVFDKKDNPFSHFMNHVYIYIFI